MVEDKNNINFENYRTNLELWELLRNKSKDWKRKEDDEFKKYLSRNRAKHKHLIIITPKLNNK